MEGGACLEGRGRLGGTGVPSCKEDCQETQLSWRAVFEKDLLRGQSIGGVMVRTGR